MSRYEPTNVAGVFLDSRSGVFYFRSTIDGKFVDRSLKTKQISVARDRATRIRKGDAPVAQVRHTFDELFDVLATIQAAKSKKTEAMFRTQVDGHLRPWFRANCPTLAHFVDSHEEIWAEYRLAQRSATPGRKLEHDRRHLVMALKRARAKGWVKRDYSKKDFELLEATEPVGKFIPDEDVRALLAALSRHPKTYLQVLIAVTMGMRLREILHLSREEVDLVKREIHLDPRRLKIRKPRQVPVPIAEDVFPLLKRACDAAHGPYLFPKTFVIGRNAEGEVISRMDWHEPQDDNRYQWERALEAAKIEVRFHDLRHTAITNALAAGMPPITAAKVFGVTEAVIKRIYDHLRPQASEEFRSMFRGKFVENGGTRRAAREK